MLRVRRLTRVLLARAGLWCVYLPITCSCVATQAIAAAADPQAPAEIRGAKPAASRPSAGSEDTADRMAYVDHELDKVDALLGAAHFHTALALARSTRDLLGSFPEEPHLSARRARLEVMAATAEVALGRHTGARQSMIRALRANPTLALDELRTSPKVLELLRATRQRSRIAEPGP